MPGAEAAAVSETGIKTGRFGGIFFRQHQNQSQKAPLWGCFFVWGRDREGRCAVSVQEPPAAAYIEACLRIALGRCAPRPSRDFPPRESHQSAPGALPIRAGSPRTPVCPKDEAKRPHWRVPRPSATSPEPSRLKAPSFQGISENLRKCGKITNCLDETALLGIK